MRRYTAVLALYFAVYVGMTQVRAQSSNPTEFYPNGFVSLGQGINRAKSLHQSEKEEEVVSEKLELDTWRFDKDMSLSISASVVVNSQDKEHFDTVYQKAFTLHKLGRMRILAIEYVGSYKSVSERQRRELAQAGIVLVPRRSLPAEYPISQSPTWRVSKGLETYVIEGFFAPERFFTKEGGFVAPAGMNVERVQDERSDGKLKAF
jgi:hypothetical protein